MTKKAKENEFDGKKDELSEEEYTDDSAEEEPDMNNSEAKKKLEDELKAEKLRKAKEELDGLDKEKPSNCKVFFLISQVEKTDENAGLTSKAENRLVGDMEEIFSDEEGA